MDLDVRVSRDPAVGDTEAMLDGLERCGDDAADSAEADPADNCEGAHWGPLRGLSKVPAPTWRTPARSSSRSNSTPR